MPGPVRRAAFKKKETARDDLEVCKKGADGSWQPISRPKFVENKNFYRPSDLNDEEAARRRNQMAKHAGFYATLGQTYAKRKRKRQDQKRRAQMDQLAEKIESRRGGGGSQSSSVSGPWLFLFWLPLGLKSQAVAPRERRDSASIVATEIQRVVRGRASRLSSAERALREMERTHDQELEALREEQIKAMQETVERLTLEHEQAMEDMRVKQKEEVENQKLRIEEIKQEKKSQQ